MNTRLLIVDDHANARELIRTFLTMPGVAFQEAASGHDALARVREFKPHWVTVDIQMPGLNGFETVKAIKEEHPEACVLIVTSFNEPHFRELARTSGAVGFILKENLLALRMMLERETKNARPSLPADGDSPVPAGSAVPGAKRILVLDDDKDMRTAISRLLAEEGYEVAQATCGLEAITLQRQTPFDLVVMELLLVGNNGFETLAELRRTASPPKFITTAKSSWMPVEVYSKMATQLGVHGTLAKPFLTDQLLTAVKDILKA
jgi:CheY-like chemotaxis protein